MAVQGGASEETERLYKEELALRGVFEGVYNHAMHETLQELDSNMSGRRRCSSTTPKRRSSARDEVSMAQQTMKQ